MGKPTAAAFAANANKYIGTKYSTMDCQAFVEKLLSDVGIKKDWTGSNAMLRDISSFKDMGTPEECVKALGCVPVGALPGIWEQDGAPSRYNGDGKGNLNHIGVKTGTDKGAVHSSQSRGCVAQSEFHDKTIRNGGWNRVLLCTLLDYGSDIMAKIGSNSDTQTATESATGTAATSRAMLRKGKKGSDVVTLQKLLRAQGYDLTPDGDFGSMTEQAVESYQASRGLEVDGVVGRMTWAALEDGSTAQTQPEAATQGNNSVTVRSLHGDEARCLLEQYATFGACVVTVTGLTEAEACYLLEQYPLSESGNTEGFG